MGSQTSVADSGVIDVDDAEDSDLATTQEMPGAATATAAAAAEAADAAPGAEPPPRPQWKCCRCFTLNNPDKAWWWCSKCRVNPMQAGYVWIKPGEDHEKAALTKVGQMSRHIYMAHMSTTDLAGTSASPWSSSGWRGRWEALDEEAGEKDEHGEPDAPEQQHQKRKRGD